MKRLFIFLILFTFSFSKELEEVKLLLKWKHSFQFAGYYAALEKGFYKEEGLDVKILEANQDLNNANFVSHELRRYAVSDSSLLYDYLNNYPVVLISQIFQHSPLVLLTHKDENITRPHDLNKKIIVSGNEIIIEKLLENVDATRYLYNDKYFKSFINKEVDALSGYSISTPHYLKEKGIEVNMLRPKDFGIDYYGDNLFTSSFEVQDNPSRVEKMKRASLRGWEYALNNPKEIIELIKSKYNQKLSIESLEFEAKEIRNIILPNIIPIGTINPKRYEEILTEYQKNINFKNLKINDDFYFNMDRKTNENVFLSESEKQWIKNNARINLTGDPNWLPIEAFNTKGEYVGIVADYLKEIAKITNIDFNIIPTSTWSQSINYSENRTVDILSDTIEAYRDDVIFTKPYFESEIVIVMNKEQNFVNNLKEIKHKKIAIVKDYSYITKIVRKYPDLNYVEVKNVKEGLKAVARGEVDAFICTLAKASYSITELSLSNVKIVGKTEFSTKLGFAVRNDYPILVSILNKAIDKMENETKKEIFNKWVKANYVKETDYSLAIFIVIISLIIVSWFIYLINRMRKEINLRKRLEDSLRKSKIEAENANKSKSEFLANMSHEIRTPMNSVIGFSELLNQTELNNKQKSYLDSIIKSSNNLLNIINDILDLSKIEAGKLKVEKRYVEVKSILNDIHHLFLLSTKQKDIEFEISIKEGLPKKVYTDEVRLRQILVNLVGNAIKFTSKGFVKIEVSTSIKSSHTCDLQIDVIDSGIGIKEEFINTIFETFEQQDGQDTRKFGGTGLGLAISQKLSFKLDARISVKSQVDKGSTFTLEFKDMEFKNTLSNNEDIQDETNNKKYFFENSLVLVVDDNKDNRFLLNAMLKEYSIRVIQATNGQEAIELLKGENINVSLVLMDIRMPIMNGYEALKIIKENPKLNHIPVIAVTASMFKDEKEKIEQKGFNGFLQKPIIQEEFINIITKHLDYKEIDLKETKEISHIIKLDKKTKELFNKKFSQNLNNQSIINNFNELKKLNNDIKNFAKENSSENLLQLCNHLTKHIETFDIENIKTIIEKLKALL